MKAVILSALLIAVLTVSWQTIPSTIFISTGKVGANDVYHNARVGTVTEEGHKYIIAANSNDGGIAIMHSYACTCGHK